MKSHSPFIALQHRDFRLLWIGLFISAIGSQMQIVAINWHVYGLTHSPISLGIIGLVRFLPLLLLSPISGSVADIFNRKKIMFISQLSMAILSGILAFTTLIGKTSPLLIYVLLAGLSMASCFDIPARQSLVPSLVPKKHFMNAVGLNSLMWQSSIVIGPSITGFIIAAFGIWPVYMINALSFISVIIAIFFMSPIQHVRLNKPIFNFAFYKEGLRFVRKTPMIYSTMILDFFATFFASANVLLPVFAKDILQVGPKGFGLLYAAPSIGAIISGLIISSFGKHLRRQGKILLAGVFLYGFSTILFGLSRSFYLSLFFLGLAGAGDMVGTIIRNTIRQLSTPDHIRGRMVAVNMIFYNGGPQLGEVEAGLLASIVGTPFSVIIGGVGTLIATTAVALLVPQVKQYNGDEIVI